MSFLLFLHATQNLITISLCIRCRFPIQIQNPYVLNNFILCHDAIRNGIKILFYVMIRCFGLIVLFRFLIRYVMD